MDKKIIAFSILFFSILLSFALYISVDDGVESDKNDKKDMVGVEEAEVRKVDILEEKIIGDKNAKIFVIEYSDLECVFCKQYHQNVLDKLVKKYENKKVGFVFRHFPLTSVHPSSFNQSKAAECSFELSGIKTFEKYIKRIFEETKNDGNFPEDKLFEMANEVGLDEKEFKKCMNAKNISEKIEKSFEEAYQMGLRETPSVFIQLDTGESYPVPADYKVIERIIDSVLR